MPLKVHLHFEVPDTRPGLRRWLGPQLAQLARLAGVSEGSLAIAFVGDRQMGRLHRQYKGVPGTTDILTFDLREEAKGPLEGDLVICLDEAARQARRHGHPVRQEVLLYALHGFLHLLGFDDVTKAKAARMHRREDELLTRAGWGPLFKARGSKRARLATRRP